MIWQALQSIFAPQPPQKRQLCVLPQPVARTAKGKPNKQASTMYVIDKERNYYGFYEDSKEAERQGAERWLTGFDKEALQERDLWGGNKVIQQNEKAKAAWASGETVAECAKALRLSDSWVEKRFGAFGAALSREREG